MEAWRWEKSLDCMSIRESYLRDPQLHLCLQIVPTAVPHDLLQAAKQRHSLAGCQTDTFPCRLSNRHTLLQALKQTHSLAGSRTNTLSTRSLAGYQRNSLAVFQAVTQTRSLADCQTDNISFRLSHRHHLFQAVTQTRSIAGCHTDSVYCRLSNRYALLQGLKETQPLADCHKEEEELYNLEIDTRQSTHGPN